MAPRLRPRRNPDRVETTADTDTAAAGSDGAPTPATAGDERLFDPAGDTPGADAAPNGHGGPAGARPNGRGAPNGRGGPARAVPERLPMRAGSSPRERTPIYDEVASAWFQEAPTAGADPDGAEWSSTSGDEGWRAAAASSDPAAGTSTTEAGLPQRRPRAQLVPGAARPGGGPAPAAPGPAGPRRNADAIRGRLASYQQGVTDGRTTRRARPAETVGDPAPSARPDEEDQ